MISYGKLKVVNTLNTLVDSLRVAYDLGSFRIGLKYVNRPLFYFKGSFIVCKQYVERMTTFDTGPEGSIVEDAFFATKAANNGFSFGWIDGEMLETSPFTFMDLLRQRRRWTQGLYLLFVYRKFQLNLGRIIFRLNELNA